MLTLNKYYDNEILEFVKSPVKKIDKEKIINPALSEADKIKNADESLKSFLPYIWNSFSGSFQMTLFPAMTSRWNDEQKLFNSMTKGLKNNVWQNNHPQPNAYTLPAIRTKATVQGMALLDQISLGLPSALIWAIYGLASLSNNPLKGKKLPGGKVSFSGQTEMQIWETKGLKSLIPDDSERLAIQLHEVGHWVEFQPVFMGILTKIGSIIFVPLYIPLTILSIYQGRLGEWRADAFAKKMGYGPQLAKALSKTGYNRRENISFLGKIDDMLRVVFTKVHNVFDMVLPITTHPSVQKRTTELLKDHVDIYSLPYDEYIKELYELNIIEEDVKQFMSKGLKSLLAPVDKSLAKLTKRLFPLMPK